MADPTKKRKLSPKEIAQAQQLVGLGLNISQIANVLGVSKATFDRRVKDQKELAEALKKGRDLISAAVRQQAFKMATSGEHPAMTIFWLKTREGFREKDREVNLNINLSTLPTNQVIEMGREAIKFLQSEED